MNASILRQLLSDELRLLTFRTPSRAVATEWKTYLVFGLGFTWIAGVGRYWDNPKAGLWQLAGLGSLAYVFVLSAILWGLLAPLNPKNWSYRNVLTFVTLTSPPAVLYAIPVERFLSTSDAAQANAWFLAIVAGWRVGLLTVFLRRVAGLPWLALITGTLLPLALIVVILALLNLEHVVFNVMSGIREHDKSVNDAAYGIVLVLSIFSFYSSPILVILYLACIAGARSRERDAAAADSITG